MIVVGYDVGQRPTAHHKEKKKKWIDPVSSRNKSILFDDWSIRQAQYPNGGEIIASSVVTSSLNETNICQLDDWIGIKTGTEECLASIQGNNGVPLSYLLRDNRQWWESCLQNHLYKPYGIKKPHTVNSGHIHKWIYVRMYDMQESWLIKKMECQSLSTFEET